VVQENGWDNWVYLIATFEYWIIRRMSSSLIWSFRYHTSDMTFNYKVRVSSPLSGLILRTPYHFRMMAKDARPPFESGSGTLGSSIAQDMGEHRHVIIYHRRSGIIIRCRLDRMSID